ncbi:MAG: phosphoribosylanthranilate isomerase [Rhodanobacter sp.]|nr:MAG: phosphoribosylanthranilate isomerase [Rhodanobacter sp.]TAM12095.1 MAG: phosphoribosylanthranilate isomerase [Rhodanobacter sp.]TAM34564.1 MAG: phosphoribosylanthranilate isomerase [Rhodanobacter sp.]
MTRVKCCGMARIEDALLAAQLGVDAVGLVFAVRSKRRLSPARAREIRLALPPFVSVVALFMDDAVELVNEVIEVVQPDLLQFHGDETDAWCAQFGRPYMKAVAMGDGAAALPRLRAYPQATALLLDGHAGGQTGGSGRTFDWSLLPRDIRQPVVLAGGLDAGNVGAAITAVRPWAVDVASGVESAPGIKDAQRMRQFVAAVRAADGEVLDRAGQLPDGMRPSE